MNHEDKLLEMMVKELSIARDKLDKCNDYEKQQRYKICKKITETVDVLISFKQQEVDYMIAERHKNLPF